VVITSSRTRANGDSGAGGVRSDIQGHSIGGG
jgi:hypothetical protein